MVNYGFHVMKYHGGKILFWMDRKTRYELAETFTLGM